MEPISERVACSVCGTTYASKASYSTHLRSNMHKLNDPNNTKTLTEYKCVKCNITVSTKRSYTDHLKTKRHNMAPEEYKNYLSQKGKNAIINGENNESFILDVLKTLDFENVVHVGNTANMFDVFVKFKDEPYYRGIQIKTLIDKPNERRYTIDSNRRGYKDDTLVIAVNNDKNKYVLIFYNEMKACTHFSATHNTNKLYDYLNLFKVKIIEMSHRSTIVYDFNDYLYKTQRLEAESMNRLKNKCEDLGIPFKQNVTNSNEIDAFVNNYNIQLKTSTYHKNNDIYEFSIHRNISNKKIPYTINDNVDFFIFEVANEIYKSNFFIIPKKILIESKYISTITNPGKTHMRIPIPNYNKYHWALPFLNRFDQLIMYTNIMLLYSNLHKLCLDNNLQCDFEKGKLTSVNFLKVKHITASKGEGISYVFNLRVQKNNQLNIIHINDGYLFIIFEFLNMNTYGIVPIYILAERRYIATNTTEGKFSISIPYSELNNNTWINPYINNFEQLKNNPINLLVL
jgi:hypothetical protein